MESKIRGGIFGVAVGDALGATVEFLSREEIKKMYGIHKEMIGGGWLSLEPGEFTDDTEMTLAVAEGLTAFPKDPVSAIGEGFIRWYHTAPKDIGNTVRLALKNFLRFGDWQKAGAETRRELNGKAGGNGCLMRTLPVTFAYLNDTGKITGWSKKIAAMTHFDEEAELACAFYNRYAHRLLFSRDKEASLRLVLDEMKDLFQAQSGKHLGQVLSGVTGRSLHQVKATGYVVDTLEAALVSFMRHDNFEDVVAAAVNLGDDADTVGAVAGGLAGVCYEYQSIPRRWLEALRHKERLEKAVQGLMTIHH